MEITKGHYMTNKKARKNKQQIDETDNEIKTIQKYRIKIQNIPEKIETL